MIKFAAIISLFTALSINTLGQTGCRRNSDGVLFQDRILLESDFNANFPYNGNVSQFCLPPGTSGAPCKIRFPLTTISYQGTFGTYSAINCDLDDHLHIFVISSLLIGLWIKPHLKKLSDYNRLNRF
jgi:hypothetical protein